MTLIVEIILCIIMAAGIVVGIKMGFIKMASKPVKLILAIIIAFSCARGFADSTVEPMIDGPITNYVTDFLYENCGDITAENAEEELPTVLKMAAGIAGIDISEAAGTGDVIANLSESLIDPVVDLVATIISFVALYVISRIGLFFGFVLLKFLFGGGVFGFADKLLGTVFATFLSIVVAWGVAVLLELVFHAPVFADNSIITEFEGGFFFRTFNEYNPVELLLSF